jgi:hypothetical protein
MRRERVVSSVIRAIGFDDDEHVLEVEFRTGRIYRYFRVPRAAYDALRKAESVGSYFNRRIRTRYRGVPIP